MENEPTTQWSNPTVEGEFTTIGTNFIVDPGGNFIVDPSANNLVDTGISFTPTPATVWSSNDSNP